MYRSPYDPSDSVRYTRRVSVNDIALRGRAAVASIRFFCSFFRFSRLCVPARPRPRDAGEELRCLSPQLHTLLVPPRVRCSGACVNTQLQPPYIHRDSAPYAHATWLYAHIQTHVAPRASSQDSLTALPAPPHPCPQRTLAHRLRPPLPRSSKQPLAPTSPRAVRAGALRQRVATTP